MKTFRIMRAGKEVAFLRLNGCEVEYLHVKPEHRGNGHATTLLHRAMEYCKKNKLLPMRAFLDPADGLTREQEEAWLKRHGWKNPWKRIEFSDGGLQRGWIYEG